MSNMDNFSIQDHNRYMKIALNLAIKGRGKVSPNPMVGCIIVKDGNIIGEGFHEKYGESHAEINALLKMDYNNPKSKILYVTLSPCRMCAKAIVNAGIQRVIYDEEYRDTSSLEILRNSGIHVSRFSP